MKQRKLTQEAAETIRKLAASQGWAVGWLDGVLCMSNRNQRRQLLAMARVLCQGKIYEPEPLTERAWRKTGEVAALMGMTTAQLTSLVYRSHALRLTAPDMHTGKARWHDQDICNWQCYQREGRLPLRK